MATVQKLPASGLSTANNYGACQPGEAVSDQFPAGLRVLVVDDDMTCLKILEQMLRKCMYLVTTCHRATLALSLLRERKGAFDLVISDVHMPDMDGFKLLEHVGLEMDLPVIMMSADGRTSAVMNGIRHGACDYLIKPVRMEELKNIWQHVARKRWNENKEHENSGSLDDSDRQRRGADDTEYASSVNDGTDSSWKAQKKKRDTKEDEDDGELDNDDPSTSKKPRVVWSVELHQQFVSAVNQLGIDKAVPKRILELMNVPGLTRENVASHLQKFRLYLKRLSGVAQPQGGLPNSYCGPVETSSKVNPIGRLDFQALAASGQIPAQTLAAALHAELLGRPSGSIVLPGMDQAALLQTSIPGPKYIPVERGVAFGQPLGKCQSNLPKQFPQTNLVLDDMPTGFAAWPSNHLSPSCSTSTLAGLNNLQNGNVLPQMLPQQSQSVLSESSLGVNVQPSCLVVPSQSPNTYQVGTNPIPINPNSLVVPAQPSTSYQHVNSPVSINQNSNYSNCSTVVDYSLISSQPSNAPLDIGQVSNGGFKTAGLLYGYSVAGSISSGSSGLVCSDGSTSWRVQNSGSSITPSGRLPGLAPNLSDIQGSGINTLVFPDQGQMKNLGFVGKGTCIPSRFAVDDIEPPTDNLNQKKASIGEDGGRVKQEIHLDFTEGSKVGNPVVPHFSTNDFMSVLSK